MVNFTTISQDPTIRALVQDGLLERAFHDSLFPRLLFRAEAQPQLWPNNVGDHMVFTGVGLMTPSMTPLQPGQDPTPTGYAAEQWEAFLQQYAATTDTAMPTSITAIANLFMRNAQQLGLNAGQSLNRIARNRAYNAAMSGQTVSTGTGTGSTSIHVENVNGFLTARNPSIVGASQVQFQPVSSVNPLTVTVAGTANTVIAAVPDNSGDQYGPGTLTLGTAATWTARQPVLAADQTFSVYVGGGNQTDAINSADQMTLSAIRAAVARFWNMNVPEMPDTRFHAHIDPTAMAQVFNDSEFNRLLTALPDYYMYKQFSIGELLNTVFYRNSENPSPSTVLNTAGAYNPLDPFGGDLYSNGTTSGTPLHRTLLIGQGGLFEYYQDLSALITDAGITGKVGRATIDNNGIEVNTDRIQLVFRSPLNRLQDLVSTSWKFIGDWPVRTDAATGDAARYKRVCQIISGE